MKIIRTNIYEMNLEELKIFLPMLAENFPLDLFSDESYIARVDVSKHCCEIGYRSDDWDIC